ncbi:MAG: hypothetical protein AAGA85_10905 [Bacteroidota bacterium]
MNIALTGVVLFLFLLPGLIFRRFYYSEEFSKESFSESYFEVFYTTFLPSLVLYTAWVVLVEATTKYGIDFALLGKLLVAKDDAVDAFANAETYFFQVLGFHITLYCFAGLAGYLTKKTVRYSKLDRKLKLFRYRNYWHYLITGELFDFRRTATKFSRNRVEDIELVFVDVLVHTEEGSVIYDGLLLDYELSHDGELESLHLTQVVRRYLREDPGKKRKESNYYKIPGHLFVVPFSKVINVNFTYYALEDLGDGRFKPVSID